MGASYYELLEIPFAASDDDVRKAIRDQRKRWSQLQGHPKLEVQHEAQLKVRELTEAEAVLTDPVRRREYDARIRPASPPPVFDRQPNPRPTPTYDRQPNPTPVLDRQPDPAPQPWQAEPEAWSPKPPREPRLSNRAKRWLVGVGLALAGIAGSVLLVAPSVGSSIRRATGNFPEMAVENYDGSFDSIVGGTDRLVGSAVLAAVVFVVLALLLLRWRKLAALLVLVLGLAAAGVLGVTSAAAFDRQARELILDGMCNGGTGSTGHTTLGGKRVDYGLNRDCNALVLWSGTTEIRTIPAPGNVDLDLHVTSTESRKGGTYVAAATMATDQGGPYTLVTFRLDKESAAQSYNLQAPARGQGFPILGENHLFQFERQSNGQGMVTALDPDTGQFDWDVTCPSGWEYLLFAYDGMIDARGTGDTVACVQQDENRLRTYLLDTEHGRLGDPIEDRAWSR